MLKTHGTLRLKRSPELRRKRIFWAATFQILLQCVTSASSIVFYHEVLMPKFASESYEQGYGKGYKHAHDLYAPKQ